MNNHKEKDFCMNKKAQKESSKNVTGYVIYNKLAIRKTSNQEHYSKKSITDSGATSHMLNLEEKMTNLKGFKIRVTTGESKKSTRGEYSGWHGC